MGMAASQARLLSITARLSDNEQNGQALSYAKERLADKTEQITTEYNNALSATKLQICTGYSDGAASFTDISFNSLTSPQVVSALGKQYIATNAKGQVLVTEAVADAFVKAKGSINEFLGALHYSVSDVDPAVKVNSTAPADATEKTRFLETQKDIKQAIHEAWDKYFNSVGMSEYYGSYMPDGEQVDDKWTFAYVETGDEIGQGYATITFNGNTEVLNYSGATEEQLKLYNYAVSLTESYYSIGDGGYKAHDLTATCSHNNGDGTKTVYDNKTAYDKNNNAMIDYYTNLFNKMATSGFYTYTKTTGKTTDPTNGRHYIYAADLYAGAPSQTTTGTPIDDPNTFEQYLKSGELLLETFSKTAGKFVSTSLSEDGCIQEVKDETAIAIAQANYEQDLKDVERLDSRYDLQLRRLDTEHNTLQQEYESVKGVIQKNVEKSFGTFA